MASISDLSDKMIFKIFEYYLKTEGYVNLIRNIYHVCTRWQSICLQPSLSVTYDGSLPFEDMMMLCEGGCFENTLNFTISSCDSALSEDQVSKLFSKLKNVNVIDLSNLQHITPNVIEGIGSNCSKLCKIQFANPSSQFYIRPVSEALDIPLKSFFSSVGSKLLSIDLSYCEVANFSAVITWITDDCPNLEELHLVCIKNLSNLFPTGIVQKKCPKLKVLKLDGRIKPSVERGEDGFPNLEVFSFRRAIGDINDEMLDSILFRSSCLKSLTMKCCNVSPNTLYSLPINDLQILNMEACYRCLHRYESGFIKKWRHSLKTVDFSHTGLGEEVTNIAVLDLISTSPSSPLEELYLRSTPVKMHTVDKILRKCSALRVLDLIRCRDLPVDMQGTFNGERELERLKGMVKSFQTRKN